jgi:hypothetical protein
VKAIWVLLGAVSACTTPAPAPPVRAPIRGETPTSAAPPAPAPAAPAPYTCTVEVLALGPLADGNEDGEGALSDAARQLATDRACQVLRERDGVDCSDEASYLTSSIDTRLTIQNGVATHGYRVRLRAVRARLSGHADSSVALPDACRAAVKAACAGAPAGSECTADGLGCREDGRAEAWKCSRFRAGDAASRDMFDPFAAPE